MTVYDSSILNIICLEYCSFSSFCSAPEVFARQSGNKLARLLFALQICMSRWTNTHKDPESGHFCCFKRISKSGSFHCIQSTAHVQ